MRNSKSAVAASLLFILSACVGPGPRTSAILGYPNATKLSADYNDPVILIEGNVAMSKKVSDMQVMPDSTRFLRDKPLGAAKIGPGDILDISIVSTSLSGFIDFSQSSVSPLSTTSLPPQEVGYDGNVNVPPIGRIKASGQTIPEFESRLSRQLGKKLVDPSVIVRLSDRRSARAAVLGRVNAPGAYSINQDTSRLLDMIGAAGGPSGRAEELRVTLNRDGNAGAVRMDRLMTAPRFNIHVHPDDVIYVETLNRRYTVLGAGGRNAVFSFDEPELSLVDALARAGGLSNRVADRRGVFLFREMPKAAIQSLGGDVSAFAGPLVSTIFRFDLSKPTAIFAISEFKMASGDVVYVSNNLVEEIAVVMSAISPFIPPPVAYVRSSPIGP